MTVTSQYQVDIAGCGNHLGIIRAVYIPAQMRDADDDITLLLLLQNLCHLVRLLDRIQVLDATVVLLNHQAGKLRSQSEDTYLESLAMQYHVWLHNIRQLSAGEIVVGTNDRELCHLEETHHIVHAVIELMVSDGGCIILHLVH